MIRPKIVAIAGGSASGKSTIVKIIAETFKDDLIVVGHDNYYRAHDDIDFEERKFDKISKWRRNRYASIWLYYPYQKQGNCEGKG